MGGMKNIIQSTALILVGLGLGLGLMEGALRILHITAPLQYEPDPRFGWGHTPNGSAWRKQDGREVQVQINAQGLRDSPHAYNKPEGVYRIIVLGDSFAEAVQVPLEASFPKLIETILMAKRLPSESGAEVINAGTSGYGTDNELLFFRTEGAKYKPDLVLLEFCICNDVRNNWYELENVDAGGFRKPYFAPEGNGLVLKSYPFPLHVTVITPLKEWLNRHVRLYPFLRETRDRLMSGSGPAGSGIPLDYQVYLKEYPESWKVAWRVTEGLLRELKREVSAHGARLFVAIVPTRLQVHAEDWGQTLEMYPQMKNHEWDLDKPNRMLGEILEREGIRYVDLLPSLRRHVAQTGAKLYLTSDGHWNEEGHRVASDIMVQELLR